VSGVRCQVSGFRRLVSGVTSSLDKAPCKCRIVEHLPEQPFWHEVYVVRRAMAETLPGRLDDLKPGVRTRPGEIGAAVAGLVSSEQCFDGLRDAAQDEA
jgi:hypothetical protein